MDKITYLAELAEGLARWVPERERQDILRYYAEYFDEAGNLLRPKLAELVFNNAAELVRLTLSSIRRCCAACSGRFWRLKLRSPSG